MGKPMGGIEKAGVSGDKDRSADLRAGSVSGKFRSLAYVVGTYPLLTTTFIDREIAHVRRRGLSVRVISLRRPRGKLSPEQVAASRLVEYVLPVAFFRLIGSHFVTILKHPLAYLGTLTHLLTRSHPDLGARWKTLLHFGEAIVVVRMLDDDPCDHVHAHFIDRATTVALVCSRILGIPYSATAHANDIYVQPVLLREKVRNARVIVTCTYHNGEYLRSLVGGNDNIVVIHHGIDLSCFESSESEKESDPAVVLAVGQLKEKKGLRYLIDACKTMVDEGRSFRCVIVGQGPLEADLKEQMHVLDLASVIKMEGALPHEDVLAWMRRASVFALPAVVAADGDRDGIPNVVLEAMAMGLPVVSTRHSGIPEAVADERSGLLVEPADAIGLAAALGRLLDDSTVRREFALDRNVDAFIDRLGDR